MVEVRLFFLQKQGSFLVTKKIKEHGEILMGAYLDHLVQVQVQEMKSFSPPVEA